MSEQQIVERLQRLGFRLAGPLGMAATLEVAGQCFRMGRSRRLTHPGYADGSVYVHACTGLPGSPGVVAATGPRLREALARRRASNAEDAVRRAGAKAYPAWVDVEGDPAAAALLSALAADPL